MYSRQEAAKLKQEFWTVFGKYMLPVLSCNSEIINWINYKTGEKDIYFRMQAGNKNASIAIELTHKDQGIQFLHSEQFRQLKPVLHDAIQEDWMWLLHTQNPEGKTISRVYTELININIFNREDWPQLISFFKPRIIALDDFWSNAKFVFAKLH